LTSLDFEKKSFRYKAYSLERSEAAQLAHEYSKRFRVSNKKMEWINPSLANVLKYFSGNGFSLTLSLPQTEHEKLPLGAVSFFLFF
jgi:Tfp pilus assembly protein PilV